MVMVEVYDCLFFSKSTSRGIISRYDIDNLSIVILEGIITYTKLKINVVPVSENSISLVPLKTISNTPPGTYILYIVPWNHQDELECSNKLEFIKGLLNVTEGRNIAYQFICRFGLNLPNCDPHLSSEPILSPNPTKPPMKNKERLENILCAINNIPNNEKTKIQLAMRWYDQADRGLPVDSFLKTWFALEALSLPPGVQNIIHIKNFLKAIYKEEYSESKYKLGVIYHLRGNLIHAGIVVPIHRELIEYIQAIFYDILLFKLNLPTEKRAETFLIEHNIEIWLPK